MPVFIISVKGQTSQDDIFGDFDENANFDDFTPDMSKPSDDFLAQMLAIGRVTFPSWASIRVNFESGVIQGQTTR